MDIYDDWDDDYEDLMCDLSSTKLHDAAWAKDKPLVQRLLNTSLDMHARDGQGRDVLQKAAGIRFDKMGTAWL
jgi:hypothetical protein